MNDEAAAGAQFLMDRRVEKLISLIRDTFRIRENHDPVYVDVGDNLERVGAAQHLIVFGRRGSGKSCLLVHHHRQAQRSGEVLSIYIQADEVKTLPFPDLLIRLMLGVFQEANAARRGWRRILPRRHGPLDVAILQLKELLDEPSEQQVIEGSGWTDRSEVGGGITARGARLSGDASTEAMARRETRFVERKLETLERHLSDYKSQLRSVLSRSGYRHATVLLDDFYLIKPAVQPDVIDYAHRLFRGSDFYLKVGTVRHRTSLARHNGSTVGVELYQDVEELDLDQTFEDVDRTKNYLQRMLDSLASRVGLDQFSAYAFNPDGLLQLTLASGGVPRDFFTIFVEAVEISRGQGEPRWLTPKVIYKGAGRVSYRTKLSNLREDVGADAQPLELVFQDLITFCLKEKRKTAFLVGQDEVSEYAGEHELIKQLMDFKLIHVIEPDTSAASGRMGRYEAYTLDFSLFMEPRLRGIEHVEFWRIDEQRRRRGVREAPVYLLARAQAVAYAERGQSTEQVVEDLEHSVGVQRE
jgi:hypothetical protein